MRLYMLMFSVCYRGLREKWEGVTDALSDTQRQLEVCLGQLSSFEDSRDQFSKWLTDTEVKVKLQADLKATLQEKKVQAQSHKVSKCQDHRVTIIVKVNYSVQVKRSQGDTSHKVKTAQGHRITR